MTKREARKIATIIAGSQIIEHDVPHSECFSQDEKNKVQKEMTRIGFKLLDRYDLTWPISTEHDAYAEVMESHA